jgi:hypothetical protein
MKLKYLNPFNYFNYFVKKVSKLNRLIKQRKKISKKYLFKNLKKISSPEELLIFHFEKISEKSHINRKMFELLLTHFSKKSLNILETGSSGTHGSGSSSLFASYVILFGGTFNTVDLNPKIKKSFEFFESENVKFHVEDSLNFIKEMKSSDIEKLDIVYLDSFDLNIKNPGPSENHGLQEFLLLNEKLKKGAIISIDDTPDSFEKFSFDGKNLFNYIPGKGRLVIEYLEKNPGLYKILYHNYALVLEKL